MKEDDEVSWFFLKKIANIRNFIFFIRALGIKINIGVATSKLSHTTYRGDRYVT